MRQRLEETRREHCKISAVEVRSLRLDVSMLYNLDLDNEELVQRMEVLEDISAALREGEVTVSEQGRVQVQIPAEADQRVPRVPADFPQLRLFIADTHALVGRVRCTIADTQRKRLEDLRIRRPALGAEVDAVIADLRTRDPITVDDVIASLSEGRSWRDLTNELGDDDFDAFFPEFVSEVVAGGEQFNRGRILTAIREKRDVGPLRFSDLDEIARKAAEQLVTVWGQVGNALTRCASLEATRRLFEALGFTAVEVAREQWLVRGKLAFIKLTCAPLQSDGWFLPPSFGSRAAGCYSVFVANPELQDDQVAAELGKAGSDAACILLVFGRLGPQQRRDFAARMRRNRQAVLLIDEAQLLFLAARTAERLAVLFACAAPFGFLEPYVTDAGRVPREMFYGRDDELNAIRGRTADGCLVYGGRQLGKSALLYHVQTLYHDPPRMLVCYRSCQTIGSSEPVARIWSAVAAELEQYGITARTDLEADDVGRAIRKWLDRNPERRILMLLDETDRFLASEARNGYHNLTRLKDLMVETAWRFKTVFAGLNNVRRVGCAPNTPLAHLGDPICIGPLNKPEGNRLAARRLVVEPMRAAGFKYEDPRLGLDILARVNYYPSLTQIFCKGVLRSLNRRVLPGKIGPRWLIYRADLFEGAISEDIQKMIRGKFRLTLELDSRYDLVANALALHRLDGYDEEVLRVGMTVQEILDLVLPWWPDRGVLERLDREAFGALLEEMVDLGVLGKRVGGDRFGLRTAQVATMLGGRGEVENRLLQLMSTAPPTEDYDPTFYRARIAPDDLFLRSPLSDQELGTLFNHAMPGPRVVAASPKLWGGDVAERLVSLAEGPGYRGYLSEAVLFLDGTDSSANFEGRWRMRQGSIGGACLSSRPKVAGRTS